MIKKLIYGPMIEKTDAGLGRLSKEAESIDFREKTAVVSMHILISLLDGTKNNAEFDQSWIKCTPSSSQLVSGAQSA